MRNNPKMKTKYIIGILICIFLISGCAKEQDNTQMANPASVYCEQNNGTLTIEETEQGQKGYCNFKDSTRCDEWEYYRGECSPGYPNIKPEVCKQQCPDGSVINCNETCSETFCGTSKNSTCKSDNECVASGCSNQICQSTNEVPTATTCEYKPCYEAKTYDLTCKCLDNKCQWA